MHGAAEILGVRCVITMNIVAGERLPPVYKVLLEIEQSSKSLNYFAC